MIKNPLIELTPNSWTPIIGGLFMSKYSRAFKC
ncbi:transcriptional regulator, partial [Vibrio vulnificus]